MYHSTTLRNLRKIEDYNSKQQIEMDKRFEFYSLICLKVGSLAWNLNLRIGRRYMKRIRSFYMKLKRQTVSSNRNKAVALSKDSIPRPLFLPSSQWFTKEVGRGAKLQVYMPPHYPPSPCSISLSLHSSTSHTLDTICRSSQITISNSVPPFLHCMSKPELSSTCRR